jgi:hypothetical protein
MSRPWGIQAIGDIYSGGCEAGLPDGSYVAAVAKPYLCNPIESARAAWWVLTGRGVAFMWPKAGDLENALGIEPQVRKRWPAEQQSRSTLKAEKMDWNKVIESLRTQANSYAVQANDFAMKSGYYERAVEYRTGANFASILAAALNAGLTFEPRDRL